MISSYVLYVCIYIYIHTHCYRLGWYHPPVGLGCPGWTRRDSASQSAPTPAVPSKRRRLPSAGMHGVCISDHGEKVTWSGLADRVPSFWEELYQNWFLNQVSAGKVIQLNGWICKPRSMKLEANGVRWGMMGSISWFTHLKNFKP